MRARIVRLPVGGGRGGDRRPGGRCLKGLGNNPTQLFYLYICHIAQLVYDVVMYKRTGELPWLARHICLGYSYAGLAKARDAS